MTNQAAQTMPTVPQAFFDEFGVNADDRVMDYGRACYAAALSQTAGVVEGWKLVPAEPTEAMCEAAMRSLGWTRSQAAATAAPITPASPMMEGAMKVWSAMLAAAPAAGGGDEPDPLVIAKELATSIWSAHYREDSPNWEPFDNLAYVLSQISNMVSGMTLVMEPPPAASVSERARALLAAEYRSHGWHEDAGRLCMGGDPTSFVEDDALRVIDRLIEQGDEDAHVITELGRLLACIAVILKGPEPAGTAWSYHDLPELVASALSEPRQVAAEMKAWARTRMAEQQSSRRDRMMVSEWAKRLLPESSFPIKDFDVEGMSITKEAAREAVKRVALKQALTQQRGAEWSDDLRAVLDAASEASQVPLMWLANQDFSPEQTKAWLCEAVDATVEEGAFSGSLHQVAEEGTGHVVAFTGCGPKSAANAKFLIWCVHFILKHRDALATTPQPSADAVLVPKGAAETARTVAEEWLAMFSDIPGLEKYERYTYGPAVEQLRDELESLLSGGSHA